MVLFWRPAIYQKDHPMPILILDLIFVAIGVAAFSITALYLGACVVAIAGAALIVLAIVLLVIAGLVSMVHAI
jgi:hypothetical protein